MNLFALVFFIESHNAQDRRQYHSRAVDPSHGLVKFYRTALFGSGDPGRTDCIVRCDAIQISRQPTQGGMQVAGGRAGVLAPPLKDARWQLTEWL